MSEFLGIDQRANLDKSSLAQMKVIDEPEKVDLVVISDAGMGFRDTPDAWPKCLSDTSSPPWILLKMGRPVGKGKLYEHLLEKFADRLVILTTVGDLRLTDIQVSKGLSWERTAQDVIWELAHNPQINQMAQSACVVVLFGTAGVVFHRRDQTPSGENTWSSKLVFDPKVVEGEWISHHPGGMIGYNTCLAAGISKQLMLADDLSKLEDGIHSGLAAMRDLHLLGYENIGFVQDPNLQFPYQRIADCLAGGSQKFASTEIPDPVRMLSAVSPDESDKGSAGGFWSILRDKYRGNLEKICEQIVLEGPENCLDDVPQGHFGALFTVDRQEIEGYRSIAALTGEYLRQSKQGNPLSIGVFGAPGSGKSFGIKQIAKTLAPDQIETLEFNLSQFESVDDLIDAMHQVRDVNLSGKFPLVFWDEFDTPFSGKPLGWLRYFLAPMQDGEFREGQIVHPIGPAIFVFAGGTSDRMERFGLGLEEQDYRSAKTPDFVSRLKGFVDILGPNPVDERGAGSFKEDQLHVIRRAILLRSILWRNESGLFQNIGKKQVLQIDRGVLRAFLHVRFFKHGIRSMESIVAMSQLSGRDKFERSSLPSEAQLDLHVDGREFIALVQQLDLTDEMLNKLARSFHEIFCEMMREQGIVYTDGNDDAAKTHSSLVEFDLLPADEQEQNRDTARDIYHKLAACGFIMIPARSNELPFKFPGDFLEELAQLEHKRWMNLKLTDGWKYGPVTDKKNKIHADLVPWDELSESSKAKDYEFVRAIPGILANAGYSIVELRPLKG
ncbi:MAG: hypothetical protein JW757_09375 [Anaerolineales bacterium]|nr:hypothetical protein [Anaerolineales bacterium]